jgi:cytochrome c-type biogenesis protein CcmH/NrfG
MRSESLVMGVAGVLLGLLAGWIIGSHHAAPPRVEPAPPQQASAPAAQTQGPPPLDENLASQMKTAAERNPQDAGTRVKLGNLYFDSGRFADAARWYAAALEIDPRNADASTDLGIAYYYMNQPDRALAQFDLSLAVDPKHSKTLLNVGIVRAWGKQDLEGAARAWQRVIDVAPGSEEASRAKQGLDGIRAAHPDAGQPAPQKGPGSSN